jgi:hypothetical protein
MFASSIRRAAVRATKFPSVFAGSHGAAKESGRTGMMAACVRRPAAQLAANILEKGYGGNASAARCFSTVMPDDQLNNRLDAFQDLFVEARMCIEDAADSAETTYFDEDAEAATEAVTAAVDEFNKILSDIEDADQKNRVMRSNGLKVEQLKGELQMAIKGGHD